MRDIYISCKYEKWGDHWFKELVEFFANHDDLKFVFNRRHKEIIFPAARIKFIPESKVITYTKGCKPGTAVINWDGDDVEELADLIIA